MSEHKPLNPVSSNMLMTCSTSRIFPRIIRPKRRETNARHRIYQWGEEVKLEWHLPGDVFPRQKCLNSRIPCTERVALNTPLAHRANCHYQARLTSLTGFFRYGSQLGVAGRSSLHPGIFPLSPRDIFRVLKVWAPFAAGGCFLS